MDFAPRILIVEDDSVLSDLFRELAAHRGYATEIVGDAESAVAKLETQSYDLIVCDKNLPGMSGLDLLKYVKATLPDLDVILMTAYADMQSVLSAISAGVYDYLVKPFDSIDEVMAKIGRALEKRRILLENRLLLVHLQRANAQIEAMNRSLEEKVAERTRQLQDANAQLEALSVTDDVTGLYNQRFLFARLEEEFRCAARSREELAVLMIDIDHFKLVNDGHDHLFGSRVLRRLGALLREGVRDIDVVVRYGGDEFVIVLPRTGLAAAVEAAERLRAAVEAADLGGEDGSCRISMSVGVAALGQSTADNPRSLLREADRALYLAKTSGRNRVVAMGGAVSRAPIAGVG